MIDYFSLLGEDRRPWIDPDLLKKKLLALSGEVHPDRVHESSAEKKRLAQHRYAELNQAYNHLRHPKERLQHLLELEAGVKPQQVQEIPRDLMEFFIEVGQLFKKADAFLVEKAKTSSPLLQVQLFETGQLWTEKLNALHQQLKARYQDLVAKLKALDETWAAVEKSEASKRGSMLRDLEELYRLFGYYSKWESQIQERIVQLSL
jgi:DnaJ-domain-containing protein 1